VAIWHYYHRLLSPPDVTIFYRMNYNFNNVCNLYCTFLCFVNRTFIRPLWFILFMFSVQLTILQFSRAANNWFSVGYECYDAVVAAYNTSITLHSALVRVTWSPRRTLAADPTRFPALYTCSRAANPCHKHCSFPLFKPLLRTRRTVQSVTSTRPDRYVPTDEHALSPTTETIFRLIHDVAACTRNGVSSYDW